MNSAEPSDLLIRRTDDGDLVIGPELVGAAGLATVAVRGGTLVLDPLAPVSAVQLRLAPDPSWEIVTRLFGEPVSTAAAGLTDGEQTTMPLVLCPDRDDLQAAAVTDWLIGNAAVPLDPRLLRLERIVAQARADSLGDEVDLAASLQSWVPQLLTWERMSRAARSALQQPHLLRLLRRAVDATLAVVDPQALGERWPDVQHADELLRARELLDLDHLDWDHGAAALEDLRPAGAASLGSDVWEGVGGVDWARVPLGATSRAEDGVWWRLQERSGVVHWSVTVAAPPVPGASSLVVPAAGWVDATVPGVRLLQADLTHDLWPVPLVAMRLGHVEEAARWEGEVALDDGVAELVRGLDPAGLVVDIHPEGLARRPLLGGAATAAQARRWAARGVGAVRLAQLHPAPQAQAHRSAGRAAFAHAARLYVSAAGLLPERASDLLAAAEQCSGAQRTLADAGGPGRGSRRVWTPNGSAPAQVAGPALELMPALTVAERWYAARLGQPDG